VKPEHGLLPARGVVPVCPAQDCVGVFATRLRDAARCLAELAGRPGMLAGPAELAGLRFGVWRAPGLPDQAVDTAAAALERAGAVPVEVSFPDADDLLFAELIALRAGFAAAIGGYLRTRPGAPQSLAELIEGNRADPDELRCYGQELFEAAAAQSAADRVLGEEVGRHARASARGALGQALRRHGVAAVLAPANPPAWTLLPGQPDPQARTSSTLPALAGYPSVSLPAAAQDGLPLGVSIFGPPRLDALLPLAAAVERACQGYRPPALRPTTDKE
jgi:amidase